MKSPNKTRTETINESENIKNNSDNESDLNSDSCSMIEQNFEDIIPVSEICKIDFKKITIDCYDDYSNDEQSGSNSATIIDQIDAIHISSKLHDRQTNENNSEDKITKKQNDNTHNIGIHSDPTSHIEKDYLFDNNSIEHVNEDFAMIFAQLEKTENNCKENALIKLSQNDENKKVNIKIEAYFNKSINTKEINDSLEQAPCEDGEINEEDVAGSVTISNNENIQIESIDNSKKSIQDESKTIKNTDVPHKLHESYDYKENRDFEIKCDTQCNSKTRLIKRKNKGNKNYRTKNTKELTPVKYNSVKDENIHDNEDDDDMVYMIGASPKKVSIVQDYFYPDIVSSDEEQYLYENRNGHKKKYSSPTRKRKRNKRKPTKRMRRLSSSGNSEDNDDEIRKGKLCKFYVSQSCLKQDKCIYMHSDFPCKHYYLGFKNHDATICPFYHGPPLTNQLRKILLTHIQTAPREILGDFPRLTVHEAVDMFNARHKLLLKECNMDTNKTIESEQEHNQKEEQKTNTFTMQRKPTEKTDLKLKYLTDALSAEQIKNLADFGVETLDQINYLTVAQLNKFGLNILQIHEIQLRASGNYVPKMDSVQCEMNGTSDIDMRKLPIQMVASSSVTTDTKALDDGNNNNLPNKYIPINEIEINQSNCTTNKENDDHLKMNSETSDDNDDEHALVIIDQESNLDYDGSSSSKESQKNEDKKIENEQQHREIEKSNQSPKILKSKENLYTKLTFSPVYKIDVQPFQIPDININVDTTNSVNIVVTTTNADKSECNKILCDDIVGHNKNITGEMTLDEDATTDKTKEITKMTSTMEKSCENTVTEQDNMELSDDNETETVFDIPIKANSETVLRDLCLPFTPVMAEFIPAKEIDASIISNGPIEYKLIKIIIPNSDYSDLQKKFSSDQNIVDPRVRRMLRIKPVEYTNKQEIDHLNNITTIQNDQHNHHSAHTVHTDEKSTDPRYRNSYRHKVKAIELFDNTINLNIHCMLQNSHWYRDLGSNQKIEVNQQLALLSVELKTFYEDPSPTKIFDSTFVRRNVLLQQLFKDLKIDIDMNGKFIQQTTTKNNIFTNNNDNSLYTTGCTSAPFNPCDSGSIFMPTTHISLDSSSNFGGLNPNLMNSTNQFNTLIASNFIGLQTARPLFNVCTGPSFIQNQSIASNFSPFGCQIHPIITVNRNENNRFIQNTYVNDEFNMKSNQQHEAISSKRSWDVENNEKSSWHQQDTRSTNPKKEFTKKFDNEPASSNRSWDDNINDSWQDSRQNSNKKDFSRKYNKDSSSWNNSNTNNSWGESTTNDWQNSGFSREDSWNKRSTNVKKKFKSNSWNNNNNNNNNNMSRNSYTNNKSGNGNKNNWSDSINNDSWDNGKDDSNDSQSDSTYKPRKRNDKFKSHKTSSNNDDNCFMDLDDSRENQQDNEHSNLSKPQIPSVHIECEENWDD